MWNPTKKSRSRKSLFRGVLGERAWGVCSLFGCRAVLLFSLPPPPPLSPHIPASCVFKNKIFFPPLVGCCVCARQSNNSSSSKPGRLTGISHCCRHPLPPPILYPSLRVLLSLTGLHNEKHFCPSLSHNGSFQHTLMLNVNKLCETCTHVRVHGGVGI